jgi:DNA-binding IclR family transcriptional regulator
METSSSRLAGLSTRSGAPRGGRRSAVARIVDTLTAFSQDQPSLSIATLTERLGVSRSNGYRLVKQLSAAGILDADGAARYRIGARLVDLARVAAPLKIEDLADPAMEQLAEDTGETVLLTAIRGAQAICLKRLEGRQHLQFLFKPGTIRPLHAGASAKVLLAFTGTPFVERVIRERGLQRFTPATPTSARQLRADLEQIRRVGYSVTHGEFEAGASAVAAPIFGRDGTVLAAISIAGPSARLQGRRLGRLIRRVVLAAQAVRGVLLRSEVHAPGMAAKTVRTAARPGPKV